MNHRGSGILAHVLGQLDFGGVETMTGQLIRHMPDSERRHWVIVTGRVDPERLRWLKAQSDVAVDVCPYIRGKRVRFIRALARLMSRRQPEAVLAYSFGNHAMVALACRLGGVRRVFVRVAGSPLRSPAARIKNAVLAHLARPVCSGEIAVSRAVARELRDGLGLPGKRVHVIANGCDLRQFAERPPEDAAKNPSEPQVLRLLMVGRMDDAKDQTTAIRALSVLRAAGREVSLSLVGNGPRRGQLEAVAQQEGVSARTRFLGNRTDVPDLMGEHDVLLHCTFSEGFPNVIIEAMAARLPVIASDIAPCREVLDNGSCGILTPTEDVRALVAAITRLMDRPELRARQAAKGRAFVERHYRIEDSARRYGELLLPRD